ncbi:hypothetical protein BOTBODRAFT_40034 [Botryobasidium botryosum FD-172 SS1]|uniref:Uncharacterized protein n=1 Tax=Botryobasidium botryosum (strain FD-172 SS1) TaxID=930990 RepID=A0A067M0V5_BOTB1|nr:hypothetical protein BOTBODRAFT_40034 [Botryobasidium botryosum FD-172 SS1]
MQYSDFVEYIEGGRDSGFDTRTFITVDVGAQSNERMRKAGYRVEQFQVPGSGSAVALRALGDDECLSKLISSEVVRSEFRWEPYEKNQAKPAECRASLALPEKSVIVLVAGAGACPGSGFSRTFTRGAVMMALECPIVVELHTWRDYPLFSEDEVRAIRENGELQGTFRVRFLDQGAEQFFS